MGTNGNSSDAGRTRTGIRGVPFDDRCCQPSRRTLASVCLSTLLLAGCGDATRQGDADVAATSPISETISGTDAASTGNTPQATGPVDAAPIGIGAVQTTEVRGIVFSSLPEVQDNEASASAVLGRLLFWDPVLSGDRDTACATCHLPEFGYTDGRARSVGTGGVGTGPERVAGQAGLAARNAPTVLNTVWGGINEFGVFDQNTAPMFWDGRTRSLVAQAIEPILALEEMRGVSFSEDQILDEVISRLSSNAEYLQLFEQAYGSSDITQQSIGQALADFQSTLIANDSPFDRWVRGDANAMNEQQLAGLDVFAEVGCAECHSGPMFSDHETHVLGVAEADGLTTPDVGDGNFGFRTPSLRQLAFTAPYFHGGQESSLDDVIDFYDNPGRSQNPNVARNELDEDFLDLPNLNNDRSNAIEAFLGSLNDPDFDRSRPASVPSGLAVGGSL